MGYLRVPRVGNVDLAEGASSDQAVDDGIAPTVLSCGVIFLGRRIGLNIVNEWHENVGSCGGIVEQPTPLKARGRRRTVSQTRCLKRSRDLARILALGIV